MTRKELRLALTGGCNYRCFFCHHEGACCKDRMSAEGAISIIEQAEEIGFSDVTLTGGEPTLRPGLLASILDHFGDQGRVGRPGFTIVTNGSGLNDALVASIAGYPGRLKVNLSLHAAAPVLYTAITGQQQTAFETICRTIGRLVGAGVSVKLNAVMLEGYNSGLMELERFIELAAGLGVAGVKFVELLVSPDDAHLASCYVSGQVIIDRLAMLGCRPLARQLQPRMTRLIDRRHPRLGIEVVRCTCAMGCGRCIELRDRTIGADLRHYPCFLDRIPPITLTPAPAGLHDTFARGDRVIRRMAELYPGGSPFATDPGCFRDMAPASPGRQAPELFTDLQPVGRGVP